MAKSKEDALKLKNQLCFPLYAAAKEVVKKYTPYLNELDLTYTQYIVMMVLWEQKEIQVKALGELLYLDSGTLTPLLKRMEGKGLISRKRSEKDERQVYVLLAKDGEALKKKALDIPSKIGSCIPLSSDEAGTLYTLLYKLLD
ncbi:DNA-binding MarR family transcriptional regulator [Aequitasia blattaphilus]|uniref:MarR family transcriptional regulator n=1 Tax=Aequitasia blattaphilus TaxID=2949332 RepID=A0ABT1E8G0_9FIRM|nr:MarR family transcriptional regulator [Aequitasia blattaphilus]MCP1102117.1 MarR family transcriptional regulator [Aequitasia blattaphilus]MCR8614757.1 MarR family transcriptional regulator [Aequitasia blattaphilus]